MLTANLRVDRILLELLNRSHMRIHRGVRVLHERLRRVPVGHLGLVRIRIGVTCVSTLSWMLLVRLLVGMLVSMSTGARRHLRHIGLVALIRTWCHVHAWVMVVHGPVWLSSHVLGRMRVAAISVVSRVLSHRLDWLDGSRGLRNASV